MALMGLRMNHSAKIVSAIYEHALAAILAVSVIHAIDLIHKSWRGLVS
jgi:hypothetical protein